MLHQALRCASIKKPGVADHLGRKPRVPPHDAQSEIDESMIARHFDLFDPEPIAFAGPARKIPEVEHDLKERVMVYAPLRPELLHQSLEREILVCVPTHCYRAHPPEHFPEAR